MHREKKLPVIIDCHKIDKDCVQVYGVCHECGQVHWYTGRKALGKIDAYSINWKAKKDSMRQRHYKDLIQPRVHGKDNPDFVKAYGKLPYKSSK